MLSPCQRPASSRPSTTNLGRGSQFWRGTVAVRLLEVGNADTDAKTEDGSRPHREAAAAGRVRNRPCFQYQAAWRTTKDLTGRTFGGRACIAQKVDFNHFLPLVRWQIISTAGGPRAVWARSGTRQGHAGCSAKPEVGARHGPASSGVSAACGKQLVSIAHLRVGAILDLQPRGAPTVCRALRYGTMRSIFW